MRETVRTNKMECTGCGACVSVCPKHAITMQPDEEGFLYPVVDQKACISCDLCEKRCPTDKQKQERRVAVLGAQNLDREIRAASSSGGVFTALAQDMIARGGVVFGAVFDEALNVEHVGAMDLREIAAMRGSKYVQSASAEAIEHAAQLLACGMPVLFSGTPCQIDGLLARLHGKNTEQLITVDIVCHGTPSPGVFASYIKELEKMRGAKVTAYSFRDKRFGWKDFAAVATFEDGSEHVGTQRDEPYLRGFLANLYLRPSCTACSQLRGARHVSDLTLADLWGAHELYPAEDDDTGLSLVIVNTQKGMKAIEACAKTIRTFEAEKNGMLRFNPSLDSTAAAHRKRKAFFAAYKKRGFERKTVEKLLAPMSKPEKIVRRIEHLPAGALRRIRALLSK